MKLVTPSVHIIGDTQVIDLGVQQVLDILQCPDWSSNAPSDGEELIEFAGRLCYRSFAPDLNPNVKRVREGNETYISNILNQKHGSVIEHSTVIIAFMNVSRIFTHELVRHRAGCSYSQESMRFVRLDEVTMWMPSSTKYEEIRKMWDNISQQDRERLVEYYGNVDNWAESCQNMIMEYFKRSCEVYEEFQGEMERRFGLENMKDFHTKKVLTSMIRRIIPSGVATHIVMGVNHRAARHILEMRASPGAEEEIDLVMKALGSLLKERYPNLYQDLSLDKDGAHFKHSKV